MINLALLLEKIWEDNKGPFEQKLCKWSDDLGKLKKHASAAKKKFHQRGQLKVYVSTAIGRKFSLRFYGQELAVLVLKGDAIMLRLTDSAVEQNKRWFKGLSWQVSEYPWDGTVCKQLRQYFARLKINSCGEPDLGIKEHRIESKFIQEMLKGSRDKFGGIGIRIRPVTIGGCPLQFSLPVSAIIVFAIVLKHPSPYQNFSQTQ